MKIKLNQDQHYITIYGEIKCGLKGEVVEVDDNFAKLIRDKFELVKEKVEEPKKEEQPKATTKKTSK